MPLTFELEIIDNMLGKFSCPSDWFVNETGAFFHRIYYSYEGKALFEDDSHSFYLKPYNLYIFPINKPYKITHDSDFPYKCLYFHINTNPLIQNAVISFNVQMNQTAINIIKAFEFEIGERNGLQDDNALFQHLLYSLLIIVNNEIEFIILNDSNLSKVSAYIQNNFMEDITNDILSRVAGYDKSYFIKLFKKTFGVTPQKYISNYRFNKAGNYLMENIPVSEVAQKVGFKDVKTFCRAFKKSKNVVPSQYKQSHYLQP